MLTFLQYAGLLDVADGRIVFQTQEKLGRQRDVDHNGNWRKQK
jgi:hypothetical protein